MCKVTGGKGENEDDIGSKDDLCVKDEDDISTSSFARTEMAQLQLDNGKLAEQLRLQVSAVEGFKENFFVWDTFCWR